MLAFAAALALHVRTPQPVDPAPGQAIPTASPVTPQESQVTASNDIPKTMTTTFSPYATGKPEGFTTTQDAPTSRPGMWVGTSSYFDLKKALTNGRLPLRSKIRIEQLVNYFSYSYPEPAGNELVAVHTEIAPAPWSTQRKLVKIGLNAKSVLPSKRPPQNVVLYFDFARATPTSVDLDHIKGAIKSLVETFTPRDMISIVVGGGPSGVILPPTRGNHRLAILHAVSRISLASQLNSPPGLLGAYDLIHENFAEKSVNRILWITGGDVSRAASKVMTTIKKEIDIELAVIGFRQSDEWLESAKKIATNSYSVIIG